MARQNSEYRIQNIEYSAEGVPSGNIEFIRLRRAANDILTSASLSDCAKQAGSA